MKWFLIPAIVTSFISLHLGAHIQHQHGGKTTDVLALEKTIGFTKDQEAKVAEVRFQLLRRFINAHMTGQEITEAEHKKLTTEATSQVDKVLNVDQRKALAEKGGAAILLDMMTAHFELFQRLKFTKEQGAQIHEMMKGIHDGSKGPVGPEAFQRIHDILTPQQLQRLKELIETGKS